MALAYSIEAVWGRKKVTDYNDKKIKRVLIVGGGTAGWISAASLSHLYNHADLNIRLVESQEIATVGVGEATVPHIRYFNARLGLDEREFMKSTQATFKLGNEFRNWGREGLRYAHPFGAFGESVAGVGFHHHWVRAHKKGLASEIGDYALSVQMMNKARFALPDKDPQSVLSTFSYAYQFDAYLYAAYLRKYSEARGVVRTEGKVTGVEQHPETGDITAIQLASGERIEADLFIDCTGFHGLLIEQTLKTGYEDWSHWLPNDRAWAVNCEIREGHLPLTRNTAHKVGWQWRIPLQHRLGNGYVHSSAFIDEQDALDTLMNNLEGPTLTEPKLLKFVTGKRKKQWNKNVVAIGLSSGFLEPLESTSIHLIHLAVTNLVEMFPDKDFRDEDRDEYNRIMSMEYTRVRDFLILHYHATERTDSEFWNYCRTMEIPDALKYEMDLFRQRAVVVNYKQKFFLEPSWLSVYFGQGIMPDSYDPLSERLNDAELEALMVRTKSRIDQAVGAMPSNGAFLEAYCPGSVTPEKALH